MKNKKYHILASLVVAILVVVIILILAFLWLNRTESIKISEGKYFDENGNQLGSCKVENTLSYLADMPKTKIYYYNLERLYLGVCDGNGGCYISTKENPIICTPISLQKPCDKKVYPIGFGATSRYLCILNSPAP